MTIGSASVVCKSILFSDNTRIEFENSDIIALVGPNNAGKSAALRELSLCIADSSSKTMVFNQIELSRMGSLEDIESLLQVYGQKYITNGISVYSGYGFQVQEKHIDHYWSIQLGQLAGLFIAHLNTESRITASNSVELIDVYTQAPQHPIHLLYADDELEIRISNYFRRAFGQELILDRAAGSKATLLVGQKPELQAGEDRISKTYLDRLRHQTTPLHQQGDGMRSFATILLHLLAPQSPSIFILDEPEAFLHPPQARLIGEFIAKERRESKQLFLATHSPDVLKGLLNTSAQNLRVVRLERSGSINKAKELNSVMAQQISADPLMKFSGVLSGIFHQRVIITESDADAMFYNAVLDLPSVHGDVTPDVLFVQVGGKHRMAALAQALRALNVPVDIIADFDILNDANVFKKLIDAMGGDWEAANRDAAPLKTAIEAHKPWLNALEVKTRITDELKKVADSGEFPKSSRSEIESLFRKASPWDAIKEAGEAAVPAGQPRQHYESLQKYCQRLGVWIVPVGVLEGFCKAVGGKGPKWAMKVLEDYDIFSAPELEAARNFVKQIWLRADLN
jgi:ABC-type cobalamin/Fe3+-siderophores transport system ATPase subunit